MYTIWNQSCDSVEDILSTEKQNTRKKGFSSLLPRPRPFWLRRIQREKQKHRKKIRYNTDFLLPPFSTTTFIISIFVKRRKRNKNEQKTRNRLLSAYHACDDAVYNDVYYQCWFLGLLPMLTSATCRWYIVRVACGGYYIFRGFILLYVPCSFFIVFVFIVFIEGNGICRVFCCCAHVPPMGHSFPGGGIWDWLMGVLSDGINKFW